MFFTLKNSDRIPNVLLVIRHTIFIAMAMWTMDKFLRPDHAATIFDHYYGLVGIGKNIVYVLATAEAALLIAFLLGLKPRLSYSLVLILHGISTIASYQHTCIRLRAPIYYFLRRGQCWQLASHFIYCAISIHGESVPAYVIAKIKLRIKLSS